MPRRKDYTTQIAAAWTRVVNDCGCDDRYFCPTADDIECRRHSGFDTCCKRPRRHIPVTTPTASAAPASTQFAVPRIDTDNLNFDDFHPLDHSITECVGYPGGRRRHLTYWWDFIGRPAVHARTLCRIGLHKSTLFKGRDTTTVRREDDQWYCWDGCIHCHKELSARQPL